MGGFLLDGDQSPVRVGLADAVALRVLDRVAEQHAAVGAALHGGDAAVQQPGEAGAVEDVVAEHECGAVVVDVVRADEERLGEAVG